MKRPLAIVLAWACLLAAGPPARADEPGPPAGGPRTAWLDIGVGGDADQVVLETPEAEGVRGVPELAATAAGERLVLRLASGRLLVARADERGRERGEAWVADDTVFVGGPDTGFTMLQGRRYRGGAKVFAGPRGRLTVANRVAIDAYLRGVLPHEIGRLDAATLEAGKAQAIAARTYTLSYIGRRWEEGFDLFDSVEDQVYGGAANETPWTNRAVEETEGIVALYQGSYIRANYHSTCGGATANVEDVWPDPPFPWLRQVADGDVSEPWCRGSKHFRWVEKWRGSEVLADLNRYGPGQSGQAAPAGGWRELRDVRVASRTPSGRVRELVFETDRGSVTVWADKVRWVLRRPDSAGGSILRSSLFKLGVRKDRRGRVTEVVASGGGNGHGTGMCQVGALAQSRAGRSYAQILHSYYTGIDLVRL